MTTTTRRREGMQLPAFYYFGAAEIILCESNGTEEKRGGKSKGRTGRDGCRHNAGNKIMDAMKLMNCIVSKIQYFIF